MDSYKEREEGCFSEASVEVPLIKSDFNAVKFELFHKKFIEIP